MKKKTLTTWGKHLMIDAYGVPSKKLKDFKALKELLEKLPKKFEMRILRKPLVARIKTEGYPDWGISGFVILYESHISFHTWPEEGYVAMDVYSCKDFDEKAITAHLKNFFGATKVKAKTVIRG